MMSAPLKKIVWLVLGTILLTILFATNFFKMDNCVFRSVDDILSSVSTADLIAAVFWEKDSSEQLKLQILEEKSKGARDQYFLPTSYVANLNNTHFDDTAFTGQYQKDVYMLARDLLRKMSTLPDNMVKKLTVIDVGCGSGWKLVNYLSSEFKTIGIETEPALSFLRKSFPDQIWINSGKEDESLPDEKKFETCDLGLAADVIEHIREPGGLLTFMKTLQCTLYIISTPKRELMNRNGPPNGGYHVREWTFHEFQLYLHSEGFELVLSHDGVQNPTTQMHIARLTK